MSHILVVDDEEAVCWALRRALNSEGHGVDVAASAEEAFQLAEARRPDAIVLDVRLPGYRRYALANEAQASGINIPDALYEQLKQLAVA